MKGRGGGGGGISLFDNEDVPIFRGYVLPDQPEFLVLFYKLFQLRQTLWIRNTSFLLAIFGKCSPESIVMIIKQHTYIHCTFRLCINTNKLSSIFLKIKCNSLPYCSPFHEFWQSFISIEVCRDCITALTSFCKKTIDGFLCLLIVFLKSKTHQLNLKDVIKLNRNLP